MQRIHNVKKKYILSEGKTNTATFLIPSMSIPLKTCKYFKLTGNFLFQQKILL